MRKVMIVDDEHNVIKGLLDHVPWERLKFTVTGTAEDGVQALAQIRRQPPDILITDIYMPNMDGLELIQAVRAEFPSVHIVIHSGYDDFDNARIAMRHGVQHFLLKPSAVSEICWVLQEVTREMEAQEKREKLQKQFQARQNEYLQYMKDALIRELLTTRYQPHEIPSEKLEMLGIAPDASVIVANLALVRPPYLTKARERDWQLIKFGAGNIIREVVGDESAEFLSGSAAPVQAHVVDMSDASFLVVCFADPSRGAELPEICKRQAERILDHILSYLKISLSAGIGRAKQGVHALIDSYLESGQALEAAEYQDLNRVYAYETAEVSNFSAFSAYPLDRLKEMYNAVFNKEHERVLEIWHSFKQLLCERRTPLFVMQNLCVNMAGVLMMEAASEPQGQDVSVKMAEWIAQIYALRGTKELGDWMSERIGEWAARTKEEISGRRTHKLVQEVKEYVKHHYDQDMTLAEIADSLYVHRNYLSHLFKRVTGETFVAYLNKFRIEKAKELMRDRHYLISEISGMVGFQNPTYFSQVFKSITGKSPSEYYK